MLPNRHQDTTRRLNDLEATFAKVRYGVVTDDSPIVKVKLGGDDTEIPAKTLAGINHNIGDNVMCLTWGADILVLGRPLDPSGPGGVNVAALAGAGLSASGGALDVNIGGGLGFFGDYIIITDAELVALMAMTLDTDTLLAANSDSRLATQKATKAYADDVRSDLTDYVDAIEAVIALTLPTADEKDALIGSYGSPSIANRYVTGGDPIFGLLLGRTLLPELVPQIPDAAFYVTLDDLVDQTPGGNNGTNHGAGVGAGAAMTIDGNNSSVFDISGGDDYIDFGAYSPYAPGSRKTFFAWVNWTATGTPGYIFGSSASTGNPSIGVTGAINGMATVVFNARGGASFCQWSQVLPVGRDVSLAVTYDTATGIAECFVGGRSVGRQTVSGTADFPTGTHNLLVGKGTTGPSISGFTGRIAHVAIWDDILSTTIIEALTEAGVGHQGGYDFGIVSSLLPSGVLFGDKCSYLPDRTNYPGVIWDMIYDGDSSYPWKYRGGPPLVAEAIPLRTTASNSYVSLPTDPLSIVLPQIGGDFDILIGGRLIGNSTNSALLSYAVGAVAANDAWCVKASPAVTDASAFEHRHTGVAPGATIAEKARVGGGATNGIFAERRLSVRPVRVG